MIKTLEQTATSILLLLARARSNDAEHHAFDGPLLSQITKLPVRDINDAVWLLKNSGYVETLLYLETVDYSFTKVWITALGRYEAERLAKPLADEIKISPTPSKTSNREAQISLPPTPVGSPFGFKDEDWEFIAQQKSMTNTLIIVIGYQFESGHYDTKQLLENVRAMFQKAVDSYSAREGALKVSLSFRSLAAGYGEHLFNQIARDIIASDIAVFDTSDLNPNVMLELGVALTWGVRVIPIRLYTQPPPPSDISGQTWVPYRDSAASFIDQDHPEKLLSVVERAIRKKARHQ